MKKMISLLTCLILLTGAMSARAEDMSGESALPWWCMLEAEDTVMTLVLPMDDALEDSFHISISDTGIMDLITCEVLGDEPNESDEPMWVGSFASIGPTAGHAIVHITRTRGEVPVCVYLLNLYVRFDGSIRITQADEMQLPYTQDMYYLQAGAFALRENAEDELLRLAGAGFDGLIKYCSDGLYRLQAGAFALRENAENQLTLLRDAGFKDAYITTALAEGEIIAGADAFYPPFFTYTVQKNDTMWGLARTFLGDGRRWEEIAQLNGIDMEIYVGQVLLIPR